MKKSQKTKRIGIVLIAVMVSGCALILIVVFAGGFGNRPRAPSLGDEPVYRNSREGFRFVAPESWKVTARADYPSGAADKDRLLVTYQAIGTDKPASLYVSMIDVPESASLLNHVGAPSHSVSDWQPTAEPAEITLGGKAATRFSFRSQENAKEVAACRRGGRVYLFTVLFSRTDTKARDLGRTAIESVVWTK
jgi:hypothetical protein